MFRKIVLGIIIVFTPLANAMDFMDASWAKKVCNKWNGNTMLNNQLAGAWIANNAGRGYKLIQMYRTECGASSKIQLTIRNKGGQAICTYGGYPNNKGLNRAVDYVLHAKDKHWVCMGEGKFGCGAIGAMKTGKLQFSGPQAEMKQVIAPFSAFLSLVGQTSGSKGVDHCPNNNQK
jgi:putative sterol carrier protein